MLFYSPRLVVSFVTCHQSLRSVPDSLTVEGIRRVTALTGEALRRIRGREPRLVVLGLNPHAGEEGLFGNEEKLIIAPAVELARKDGWNVEGPIPPDAAFMPHVMSRYDGHVTLYHDQGAIPFKMISLHDGVNVTMGLPIVRTSVDHGTAYDIAWQGKANESSLISAIRLAAALAPKKNAERGMRNAE
jgi:4-hydroxythreonine-4-phosphate dehydrogenase